MPEEQSQKTEQPTPRRKQKAREEGQIPSSRELTSALQFGATVLLLTAFGTTVVTGTMKATENLLAAAFRGGYTAPDVMLLLTGLWGRELAFMWQLGVALVAIGILTHLTQTGFAITPKRLVPELGRLNPINKLKELPGENLMQMLKGLLLLPFAGLAFWYVMDSEMVALLGMPRAALPAAAKTLADTLSTLLTRASLILLLVGFIDFMRQRHKINKKLKMSKHEVKQEHKETEGNPQIKARQRQIQREMARKRMMADVAEASVVVTNPTHYAVALKYDPDAMPAPKVVAKGLDFLALRIRAVAEEHQIPIVENPPLAQALYKGAEVGQEIPANLYRAVAEILAYIFRLSGRGQ